MAFYSHFVKGGEVLIDPTSKFKDSYVVKCSECEKLFGHINEFVTHCADHDYDSETKEEASTAFNDDDDGNTNCMSSNENVRVKCENITGNEEEEVFTIVKEEPKWGGCHNDDGLVDEVANKEINDVPMETISKRVESNGEIFKISEVNNSLPQASDTYSAIIQMLGKLSRKMDMFSDKFETFKIDIQTQNSLLVNVLGEHNIALRNVLRNQNPMHTKKFPIKSVNDLKTLDESIDDTNEKEYIATITAIIGRRGLIRGLADIVVPEVLVEFNVEGIHNKLRLLDLKKFINVLFLGAYDNNASPKSFKEDLKHALRLAKNRFFKGKTKEKKLHSETITAETFIAEIDEDIKLF